LVVYEFQGELGMDTYSRRRRCSEAGTTVVESAIVLLTFFMLLFGVFEAGRFLNTEQVLTNAAREGARLAVTPITQTNILPTHAEIIAHVNQFLADAHITGATVSAPTQVSVTTGLITTTYTEITVSKNYQVLSVPYFFSMLNVTLSGRALMRNETSN
jgi:Flp pilus assembly protein TadG